MSGFLNKDLGGFARRLMPYALTVCFVSLAAIILLTTLFPYAVLWRPHPQQVSDAIANGSLYIGASGGMKFEDSNDSMIASQFISSGRLIQFFELHDEMKVYGAIVELPLFWPMLLAAIGPFILLKKRILKARHARKGCCLKCGYSLVGLTSDRCPECGKFWRTSNALQ
ncbi:MAG: hypothetical protein IPK83_23190 [Planctomycetes bacterium]|nr:hypothetical protein [Planctomycetota bacterium]